jgi:hypothetical protein
VPLYIPTFCLRDIAFFKGLLFATIYEKESAFLLAGEQAYPLKPVDISLILK